MLLNTEIPVQTANILEMIRMESIQNRRFSYKVSKATQNVHSAKTYKIPEYEGPGQLWINISVFRDTYAHLR